MSERGDAMSNRSRGLLHVPFRRMFMGLTGLFVSRQVLLFSVLFPNTMGVRGDVVQFGGLRVVLVMRSIVIASGHSKASPFSV